MRAVGRAWWIVSPFIITAIWSGLSQAGFERRYAGSRSLATAGAISPFSEDAWAFYANPARAARIDEAGVFYVPDLFGVPEINSTGVAWRGQLFGFNCGSAFQTFGYDYYRESTLSVNLSAPVERSLFLGTNFNLNHLSIRDYGTDLDLSIDAGARMFLSDEFSVSFCMTNLNSATMTISRDRLPQTLAAGIGYQSEILYAGVVYFKELGFPASMRIGAEYSPLKFLTLRVGSESGSNAINTGFALRFMAFTVEYGVSFHSVLGTTQSFGVSVRFHDVFRSEFEKILEYRKSLRNE